MFPILCNVMISSFSVIALSNLLLFSSVSFGNEIVFRYVSRLLLEKDTVSLYK